MSDQADGPRNTRKMLVADDDPAVVRLLASRCTDMGFSVETASNGIQALLMARRSQPDVVIIDVNMPEVDGLSVCTRLLEPDSKPLDVIVITGTADPVTIARCKSLGTFYGHKGPEFWPSITSVLRKIFPDMAQSINQHAARLRAGVRVRPCVLIVDDDPDIETLLSQKLARCGVDTMYAADGLQGFRLACKEAPAAIICDCFMLNGDAHYLLWRLRSTPETKDIPLFIISGRRLDDLTERRLTQEMCGRPGAAHIFVKSSNTNALFEALQKVCAFRRDLENFPI